MFLTNPTQFEANLKAASLKLEKRGLGQTLGVKQLDNVHSANMLSSHPNCRETSAWTRCGAWSGCRITHVTTVCTKPSIQIDALISVNEVIIVSPCSKENQEHSLCPGYIFVLMLPCCVAAIPCCCSASTCFSELHVEIQEKVVSLSEDLQ